MRILTVTLLVLALAAWSSCDTLLGNDAPFESYRYELWKLLVADGVEANFVGTQTDSGTYPSYQGQDFDRDHQGIGGIETEGVLADLPEVLSRIAPPDIVLLGIGGNDLAGAGDEPAAPLATIDRIIDRLQAANPRVVILVEQIAPGRSDFMTDDMTRRFEDFNARIPGLAESQTDSSSTVVVVDMYTGFSDNLLADDVHYNEQGARFVAGRYAAALRPFASGAAGPVILPLGDSRVEGNRP